MAEKNQLVIKPPLPEGVDEADLLAALKSFPSFTRLFLFRHFYLMVFSDHASAARALAQLPEKLPAKVHMDWDNWKRGDPDIGPFPDVTFAVESQFVYIPRNFLPATAIKKMASGWQGFAAGRDFLRGYGIKFNTIKDAHRCLDFLYEKTNLLPYFVDKDGKAVEPSAALDRLGDIQAAREEGNQDLNSASTARHISIHPAGDEYDLVIDLLASFYGFVNVAFDESMTAIATFSEPQWARRATRYFRAETPADVQLLQSAPQKKVKPPGTPTQYLHMQLAQRVHPNLSGPVRKKRMRSLMEGYEGYRRQQFLNHDCLLVEFVNVDYATAALKHLAAITNFPVSFHNKEDDAAACPHIHEPIPVRSGGKWNQYATDHGVEVDPVTLFHGKLPDGPDDRTFLTLKGFSKSLSEKDIETAFGAFSGFKEATTSRDATAHICFETEQNAEMARKAIEALSITNLLRVEIAPAAETPS